MINGFNMIALNFQPLDGSDSFAITNLIQNKEDLVAGVGASSSDQIQVWDGSQFTTYFYRMYKATNPNKFTIGPCWVKTTAPTAKTGDTIPRGAGVWFARPASATPNGSITVSGSVNASSFTHDILAGFNMISSAFPTDMALNDGPIDWDACGAVAGVGASSSDQIQVWDGSQFTTYFYRMYKATNPNKFTLGPCWVKTTAPTAKTTDSIPAGKGFWYARPSSATAGTLIETSPIAE